MVQGLLEDHPRSRGVYINRRSDVVSERGSSPLARGLPLIAFSLAVPGGIIPARAGFTRARCRPGSRPADHPRSRGVYSLAPGSFPTPMGSSPLARGLLVVPTPRWGVVGIIPARAGFTLCKCHRAPAPADHPRSRGVYCDDSSLARPLGGSSPLARGLRRASRRRGAMTRIIPARAGFTPRH